jgi:hypothetical protein
MPDQPIKHGHQHRFGAPDAILTGQYEIKVFPDQPIANLLGVTVPVVVGNDLFSFVIPEDLDRCRMRRAEAFLSTAASGAITVGVRNVTQTHDLLTSPISIAAGMYASLDAVMIKTDLEAECAWGDIITIDVLTAGAGGWGLGVVLEFGV